APILPTIPSEPALSAAQLDELARIAAVETMPFGRLAPGDNASASASLGVLPSLASLASLDRDDDFCDLPEEGGDADSDELIDPTLKRPEALGDDGGDEE